MIIIAEGSVEECRYYLILARDLAYADTQGLTASLEEVSRLLSAYTTAILSSASRLPWLPYPGGLSRVKSLPSLPSPRLPASHFMGELEYHAVCWPRRRACHVSFSGKENQCLKLDLSD